MNHVPAGSSGAEPGTSAETCPTCGGRGQVQQTVSTPFGQMAQITVCPTCHGKGKVIKTTCRECRGQGRVRRKHSVDVKIPAGIDTGIRLRVSSQGEAGVNGGPSGDLFLLIECPHLCRPRKGDDLHTSVDILYPQVVLVRSKDRPDGRTLDIPAGTRLIEAAHQGKRHAETARQRQRGYEHTVNGISKDPSAKEREPRTDSEGDESPGKEQRGFFDRIISRN